MMRIRQSDRRIVDRFTQPDSHGRAKTDQISFSEVMKQKEQPMQEERLTRLLQEIAAQSERLGKSCSIRDLKQYKLLVKQFMEEAVKFGVAIDERQGFGRRNRTKRYKIVREVDGKLLELTDIILSQEASSIAILDRIGEIRGMLVNLYM